MRILAAFALATLTLCGAAQARELPARSAHQSVQMHHVVHHRAHFVAESTGYVVAPAAAPAANDTWQSHWGF